MKKIISKILSFMPFIIGVILMILIFTGKLDRMVEKIMVDKGEKVISNSKERELVYIDGKLQLLESYEWSMMPMVEEYDKDNKEKVGNAYGITKDEERYINKLNYEFINSKIDMNENQFGNLVYNKSCLRKIGEEFNVEPQHMNICVNSVSISKEISEEDLKLLDTRYKDMENYLDENNKIKPMTVITKYSNENKEIETEEYKTDICFAKLNITYKSYSPWVQETGLSPDLVFLNEYDDRLEYIFKETAAGMYSDTHMISLYNDTSAYSSLNYYDENSEFHRWNFYPMMKGEEITVDLGFFIPERFLDKAYICYSYMSEIDNYYKDTYKRIIKVSDEK